MQRNRKAAATAPKAWNLLFKPAASDRIAAIRTTNSQVTENVSLSDITAVKVRDVEPEYYYTYLQG